MSPEEIDAALDLIFKDPKLSPAREMGPLVCHEYGTGSFRLLAVC